MQTHAGHLLPIWSWYEQMCELWQMLAEKCTSRTWYDHICTPAQGMCNETR